ncbi:hypothetical protein MHI12_01115 [Paenibacillus sp. FSL H8-0280]|uniref:hypothetical protein n=1 Tax=Paenibacillus sp. FSL H8-0280 TaxID=2921382 RepID=UPI0032512914
MKIIADKPYIVQEGQPLQIKKLTVVIMMKKDRRSADEAFSRSFMSWIRLCASSSDVYQYWLTMRGLGENTSLQSRKYLLTT